MPKKLTALSQEQEGNLFNKLNLIDRKAIEPVAKLFTSCAATLPPEADTMASNLMTLCESVIVSTNIWWKRTYSTWVLPELLFL